MFTPPPLPQPPEALVIATELLQASDNHLSNLMKFRSEQFQRFWFKSKFVPRTAEEINDILVAMDGMEPGLSARFFIIAKAVVDFIEALSPGRLQPEDWYPRYDYTVDPQTYSLRVIPPPPPEPEPEPPVDPEPNPE